MRVPSYYELQFHQVYILQAEYNIMLVAGISLMLLSCSTIATNNQPGSMAISKLGAAKVTMSCFIIKDCVLETTGLVLLRR